jgi:hypothetical protein
MLLQQHPPNIEVVGLYSLSANKADYARFIQESIEFLDPINLSEEEKTQFRRLGREDCLAAFTDEDRREMEAKFRSLMDEAVVVEALVSHADENFYVGDFVQPDPSRPEGQWQVAWNEKFLTADGEALLPERRSRAIPDERQFRIVFVIHFWKVDQPLHSSYGVLSLPTTQPLPERLWQLAPYERPD